MSNSWFQFKQFRIEQQRAALKVGTDGVLLGAWCAVTGCDRILDAGTGSGLIALMVAQRSAGRITAIEIDPDSFLDAELNFRNSPWNNRLQAVLGDFKEFEPLEQGYFDLVVSNPPFFQQSLKSAQKAVAIARHDESLTFVQLIEAARRVLVPAGRLAVILPAPSFAEFKECARLAGFYLRRKTMVIPREGKMAKRVLLEFSLTGGFPEENELVLLDRNGICSESYRSLTGEFYLHF